jgi:hypothetical protein
MGSGLTLEKRRLNERSRFESDTVRLNVKDLLNI